jgi:hypothetical protein
MGKDYRPRKSRSATKSKRPASVEDAVERIRKFVVQLFVRDDGEGVDWSSPMIAEALLKLGFHALDRMPRDCRRYALLRRVEMGVYNRMTVLVTESYVEAGLAPCAPPPDSLEGPQRHFSDDDFRDGASQ